MSLQPHLKMAAYRLPFSPTGSWLFGLGMEPLLKMDEDLTDKKHTRAVSQMMAKTLTGSGGARSKTSPQAYSQRGRGHGTQGGNNHGRGNRGRGSFRANSRSPGHTNIPFKKGDGHKGDKGRMTNS